MINAIDFFREEDACEVTRIWAATFGSEWSIDRSTLLQACMKHGGRENFVNLVARYDNHLVGFLSSQFGEDGQAGIIAICIDPEYQRRQIGTHLLADCGRELSRLGAKKINLGSGGHSYLWPGVPVTSVSGRNFFEKAGWQFDEELYDMVANLNDASSNGQLHLPGEDTRQLKLGEEQDLLAFAQRSFPYWKVAYERVLARDKHKDIIVALKSEVIVGAVVLFMNSDQHYENGLAWRGVLGQTMGGFAVLGVREDQRGRGVGLRLASHATFELKSRGVENSLAGWTYLENLYGQIGYKVWRRYLMSDQLAPEILTTCST